MNPETGRLIGGPFFCLLLRLNLEYQETIQLIRLLTLR